MTNKRFFLVLWLCLFAMSGFARFLPASYQIKGFTLPYRIMYPENYDPDVKYPLLIFLHGAGERGSDNEKQLTHGKDFFENNFYARYPAIVIAPQCPEGDFWSNVQSHNNGLERTFTFGVTDQPSRAMETLIFLIQDWLASGRIDTNRVYIGGLSMGGMGTYEVLWRMPDTFAAAFPICGGGDIDRVVQNAGNTSLRIFHGTDDNVVPVSLSRDMYKALQDTGKKAVYTEYPGVNHGSWNNAFAEADLASWLSGQTK